VPALTLNPAKGLVWWISGDSPYLDRSVSSPRLFPSLSKKGRTALHVEMKLAVIPCKVESRPVRAIVRVRFSAEVGRALTGAIKLARIADCRYCELLSWRELSGCSTGTVKPEISASSILSPFFN
jgi:hypothetical protein